MGVIRFIALLLCLVPLLAFGTSDPGDRTDCASLVNASWGGYSDKPFVDLGRYFQPDRALHPELYELVSRQIAELPDAPQGSLGERLLQEYTDRIYADEDRFYREMVFYWLLRLRRAMNYEFPQNEEAPFQEMLTALLGSDAHNRGLSLWTPHALRLKYAFAHYLHPHLNCVTHSLCRGIQSHDSAYRILCVHKGILCHESAYRILFGAVELVAMEKSARSPAAVRWIADGVLRAWAEAGYQASRIVLPPEVTRVLTHYHRHPIGDLHLQSDLDRISQHLLEPRTRRGEL